MDSMEPIMLNLPAAAIEKLKHVADDEFRTSEAQATVFILEALGILKKSDDSMTTTPKAKRGR